MSCFLSFILYDFTFSLAYGWVISLRVLVDVQRYDTSRNLFWKLRFLIIQLLFVFTGVSFPMGRGMYRVVHIPEDEAVLLNSREKAPYLICVEVVKSEVPK